METDTLLTQQLAALLPHLNERQRRLLLAVEARALGYGGIARVARAAGVSRPPLQRAVHELTQPRATTERVRHPGGGRKPLREQDPGLGAELEALVDPDTRGAPLSPLRWTCKSTRQLADALAKRGPPVSHRVVAALLQDMGYSLQANRKTREGVHHPDRDAQFPYLNDQINVFLAQGLPVVSVDTKQKERVGPLKNGGRDWHPAGQPELVSVHDCLDPDRGKAIPSGIYDVGRHTGWVTVGQDHDTARFAVASLRRWWHAGGVRVYPHAAHLLICADGGGSNGYRVRLWKVEWQGFANDTGWQVTVCHVPPGTSQWNKIEHRLVSPISRHWRGRPLVRHEVVVDLISATTTRTGLQVQAEVDTGVYPTQVKGSDAEMALLRITPHQLHGEWNYTIPPLSSYADL